MRSHRRAELGGDLVGEVLRVTCLRRLAERSIFCPCSSVPVRNQVSMPSARLRRAMTSQTIVV